MELTTDQKGGIAELMIAAAAAELGIGVFRPLTDGERYDLIFDLRPSTYGERFSRTWIHRGRD